ncbi:M16 family metallopeptidase [Streptomyces sp. NRRL F-5053]|uniref:M16 family metallopeptidase n=1 Tax=Streptomyces sp. NRRL F-5053 TaxID=1463854 RepID=UPI00068DDD27|nr:insulinase family protein [Streptomyces sp. NRRL F-5053]
MTRTTVPAATAAPGSSTVTRARLPNGLRVVVETVPGAPRAAVSVHYGVGYRAEPPGRAGFAHLFEHLMTQGSESLPGRAYIDRLLAAGGNGNASTHQDYTDFHQVVPHEWLERALFCEADRMRAPVLTEHALAGQLAAVAWEIKGRIHDRPHGGLPWPLLPGVLFSAFPNAHDGYGDLRELAGTTVAECAAFFERHYGPGNAVLTVLAPQHPDEVLDMAGHHFAGIAARPVPARPSLAEPAAHEDRIRTVTGPGSGATAVAVGHRLPDPAAELPGYLAHLALAGLASRRPVHVPGAPPVPLRARCGFFAPLDALDPDALVCTATVPGDVPPRTVAEAVRASLREAAADPRPDDVAAVGAGWRRTHDDLLARCRARGRTELLFGDPSLVDEVPRLLARLGPDDVTAAASGLDGSPCAVLAVVPGGGRPAAAPLPDGLLGSGPPAPDPAPAPLDSAPAPAWPALGTRHAPSVRGLRETTLGNGLRVTAVRAGHAPLVEARLRFPDSGARAADEAVLESAAALLRARCAGGPWSVRSDGIRLTMTGSAPADRTEHLLAQLRAVLAPPLVPPLASPLASPPAAPRRPLRARTENDLAWHVLAGRTRGEAAAACAVPDGATLVVVGDAGPDDVTAAASRLLGPWQAGPRRRTAPDTAPRAGLRILPPDAHTPVAFLGLCAPDPTPHAAPGTPTDATPGEAARFLAVGVLGGQPGSRFASLSGAAGAPLAGGFALAGRDVLFGAGRVLVSAGMPPGTVRAGVAAVCGQLRLLAADPPTAAEVRRVAEFGAGQLSGVFDSQAALADHLVRAGAQGQSARTLLDLPRALRETGVEEVAEAARRLFGEARFTGVLRAGAEEAEQARQAAAAVCGEVTA